MSTAREPARQQDAAPERPVPVLEGTFAIYNTPDGGMHIAYKPKGETDSRHQHIPAFVVKMAGQASGLDPQGVLARLTGAS